MELALYCPDTGFYEKDDDTLGRGGHFFTSVSVGPLFGDLLAYQIAEWMIESDGRSAAAASGVGPTIIAGQANSRREGYLLIEAGAHRGQLARDILTWLRGRRPELLERIEYWIIEPSPRRQQWQARSLAEFRAKVHWADSLASVRQELMTQTGIIIANELLDAMPVHRLGWDAHRRVWFEWGVAWRDDHFAWVRLSEPCAESGILSWIPPELLAMLPDGFSTEICPLAEKWWGEAAGVLQRGKLLTFDYGLEGEEFIVPHRAQGTLRAFRNHRCNEDLLADPGEQDITAHVNLSRIRAVGEAAGLRTESRATQAQFLTEIATRFWQEPDRNGRWSSKQIREFQTLVHPQHLGRAFCVVLQSR